MGAVGGLLGGFGFSMVVNQTQGLRFAWIAGISFASILVGAAIGYARLPSPWGRIVQSAMLLWAVVTMLAFTQPVVAQSTCGVSLTSDAPTRLGGTVHQPGESIALENTTASSPFVMNLDSTRTIDLEFTGIEADGFITVTVGASEPLPVDSEVPVYQKLVGPGSGAGTITVDSRSRREVNVAEDGATVAALPFGLVRLDGVARDATGQVLCQQSEWIRFVSSPFGFPGWILVLCHVLGITLVAGAATHDPLPPSRRRSPDSGRRTPEDDIPDDDDAFALVPNTIPPHPMLPRLQNVEAKMFDESGRPAPADEPLAVGRSYSIDVTLKLDGDEQSTEPVTTLATVSSRGDGSGGAIEIQEVPAIDLSAQVGPINLKLPIQVTQQGRVRFDIDVLRAGRLLHSERFHVTAVDDTASGGVDVARVPNSSHSIFQGADEGAPRDALIMVYRQPEDTTVDFRIIDGAGTLFHTVDTPLIAATIDAVVQHARQALVDSLLGDEGFGAAVFAAPDLLDSWLPKLASAGTALRMELMPTLPGAPPIGLPARPDGTVQINEDDGGLGHMTIPWNLMYDFDFEESASSRTCRTFAQHEPDACPEAAADASVACPYGFWGYRYSVEQPPTWVHKEVRQPLIRTIGATSPIVVSFNVDPSFALWRRHVERLREAANVEILQATNLDEMRNNWSEHQERLELLYFYSHHVRDGLPVLSFGEEDLDKAKLWRSATSLPSAPLVVLSGCGTGSQSVSSYATLIDAFRTLGASAVIGTECIVTEEVAEAFMYGVLVRVLTGEDVGAALLRERRDLLTDKWNPAGFVYALYGFSDLAIEVTPETVLTEAEA